jgi:diadenosine tetraphosphatase ApaH/serine/threonine PP2A family protein phosphatase
MNSTTFKRSKDVIVRRIQMPKGRVMAIGDIHGCLEELKELWEKLSPTVDDVVVFLGDLVDRGPDSEGVVQFVKDRCLSGPAHCVSGNHDAKHVRYHYHVLRQKEDPNYKVPMRCPPSYNALSESSLAFLNSCPHAVFIPKEGTQEPYDTICVHAGLSPSLFKQEANAFIRNRYFTKNVKDNRITPVQSKEIDDVWYVPEGSYPWSHFWDGRWTVLYGHAVYYQPEIVNNTIGIDGGCCFGGVLRAWVKPVGGTSFFIDIESKQR